MQITILTDKSSWMNKYDLILKNNLEDEGHIVSIAHSKHELRKGDIAFLLSCFEIIDEKFLVLNKNNIVVHASDLPKGRGWSPTTWQILENKNIIPITLFEADKECDSGDYYIKSELILNGTELIDEWQEKLGEKIIEMCLDYVKNYSTLSPIKQTGEESFYRRRNPKDSELDPRKTIEEQFNLLRTVDNENYPAFFMYNNERYILKISKG